jgi:hypothetical protein
MGTESRLDRFRGDFNRVENEKNQTIEAPEERVASLEGSNSERADDSTDEATTKAKQLGTKERESLLKMIIGMARGGYAHDPKLNRSAAVPQEIANVLAKHGVALDGDTVRKWLREAAEFLPHE